MDSKWHYKLLKDGRKLSLAFVVVLSVVVVAFYSSELFKNEKPHIVVSNSWAPSPSSGNMAIGKKVAAIIENRPSDKLIPLILHFSSVLGPSWPIVLFTSLSPSNLTESARFKAGLDDGQFEIKALPSEVQFTSHKDVSSFLTKPWFWEQLAPADHVLLFQSDSIICANAKQHVDDFLQYDMVGAPIAYGMGQGYNGGLSLRSRTKILDIIKKNNWEEDWDAVQNQKAAAAEAARLRNEEIAKEEELKAAKEKENGKDSDTLQAETQDEHSNGEGNKLLRRQEQAPPSLTYVFPDNWTPPWKDYEDQWFFWKLTELPRKWNRQRGANLPPMEVAMTFAVETVYYDTPLGYHQVGLRFENRTQEIELWCPEYHLCTDERFSSAQ